MLTDPLTIWLQYTSMRKYFVVKVDKIQWNSELSLHILSRDEKLRTVYKIFSASEIERPQCECCASWRKESKFARISKRRLSRFKRCHVSRLHFRRLHFGCRRNSPEWQTSRAVVERLQYIWNGKKSDKEVQSMPHFVKCFKMSTQLQARLCWLDCMFWFWPQNDDKIQIHIFNYYH